MSTPTKSPAWLLAGQNGPSSLEFVEEYELPPLRDNDVLVRIHAASLNYREIAIAKGKFNLPLPSPIIPSSDGAGTVVAMGSSVKEFKKGDRVVTHLTVDSPEDTAPTFSKIGSGLGQIAHGTLTRYGVFHSTSLVKMPETLGFREAATLTCSGLTAWNALFGIPGKFTPGNLNGATVLVQGSGGVSVAALQFALASGATVIATTSSEAKALKLKGLGASYVLNYKTTTNWGEIAKLLTPDSRGVDIVVDVGGPSTVGQSLKAVRTDGVVALAGLLGAGTESNVPSIMDALSHLCITRGFLLGSRVQFREMNRFIDEKGVKPVVDEKVFTFKEVKEAYEYMEAQRHFSKIAIDIE
ncbi:alcohol dehydrogenase [Aspergillus keveii]|uniref:Alcohol dehydrogenase n=1 Tax=Aspergillus keveii TaxID=714993 RepID=A0ABR4FIM4_9EURO